MKRIYLHTLAERIWHWLNAALFIILFATGIQLHWPDRFSFFKSFSHAVLVHNWAGILLVAVFVGWLFYKLISKRMSQYILTKEDFYPGMFIQTKYYLYGIFIDEPHPYIPSEKNKFNPLQKLAYFMTMFLQMPLLLISGILYLYPDCSPLIIKIGGLKTIAVFHLTMAIVFACFLVIHLYLSTTGDTIFSSIKTMISGYEERREH
jgi:formate dehydrogenase gamma subunit